MIVFAEIEHLWERGSDYSYRVLIDTANLNPNKAEDKLVLDAIDLAVSSNDDSGIEIDSKTQEALFEDIEGSNRYASLNLTGHKLDHHITLWWG
jgi:hypothetical protein